LAGDPQIASVIVVDNCSSDNTRTVIKHEFPQVTIIANPQNEGYGRACNIGLEKVTTPYAILVNPDAVLKPGATQALLDASARYNDAALLAPLLYNEDG